MYHYNLRIHIFSEESFWETELSAVVPRPGFEHEFHVFGQLSAEALEECDVALLDLAEPDWRFTEGREPGAWTANRFHELRRAVESGARLILCAEAEDRIGEDEEAGGLFDEIWVKPIAGGFARARFGRVLDRIRLEKDYRITDHCLDSAINSIPDLVWFKDVRGAHLRINDAFCHAVGKTREQIEGRGHYYIWDLKKEEYEKGEYVCLETEEIVLREKKTCLFDEKVLSKNGLRQFKTYKSPIFGEDGSVLGTVGIAHDVTDLRNIGTELQIVLNSLPFAILMKNDDGEIINANEKLGEYFRMEREDIIGRDYENWKNSMLRTQVPLEGGDFEGTLERDGRQHILEIHEEPIYDIFDNLVGQFCIFRDVTVERELERQILHNSNTDFMTGLFNRRCFYEYMGKNRGDKPVSIVYVDLDYFKRVNDTYGHQVGDEALILTADLLRECFPDSFIARLGGDEFLITIIGQCELEYLTAQSDQLLRRMKELFGASQRLHLLSASIGIAQTDDPNLEIDTLIHLGDLALYAAKQGGRSRYCVYEPELLGER